MIHVRARDIIILAVLATSVAAVSAFPLAAARGLRALSYRCWHKTASPACCCGSPDEQVPRRQILLTSVSGIVGSKVGGPLPNRPMRRSTQSAVVSTSSSQQPLRVCVVGAGSISREFALYHFGPATRTVVTSIVDLDLERARRLAMDVGSVQAGASVESKASAYAAAASDTRGQPVPSSTQLAPCLEDCDIVYIGTTPNSHAKLVLEALEAGKSVLLEKPLAAFPVLVLLV